MSNEEQTPASGSVPNAFGNALAWKWSRQMPRALKPGLLTLLYALRAMASASGELKFGDGKAIRIQDIAKAAGADEKDARDRVEAAIRAGVVMVKGERRRGRAALYVIVPTPYPNWAAAAEYLAGAKQLREEAKERRAARKEAEKFGGRTPEPTTPKFGGPTPELTDGTENEVQGTYPRLGSGDVPPIGSGDVPPNNPGSNHGLSHDGAEVSFQPQVVGPPAPQDQIPQDSDSTADDDTAGWTLCARCNDPMLPRYGRTTHAHCQPLADTERSAS